MSDIWTKFKGQFARFSGNSDLGFVFGLFGAVLLLVVPVHKDILSIHSLPIMFLLHLMISKLQIRLVYCLAIENESLRYSCHL